MDIFTIMEHFLKHGKTTTKHHGLFGDNDPLDVCEIDPKFYQLVMLKSENIGLNCFNR